MTQLETTRAKYYDLQARAAAKGIKTFGDIVQASGVDAEDLWLGEWDPEIASDKLYWCDAAHSALEMLADEGEI